MANRFYALIEGPADKDSFDLADLGPTRTHLTPFGFMRNGKLEGFEPFVVPTRASDYDEAFLKKLLAIQPVLRWSGANGQ